MPSPSPQPVLPTQEHAAIALREVMAILAPLVRWLLRNGVPYGPFAEALKPLFIEVARSELQRTGGAMTQSALSVLSGVHRKDVRALSGATGLPQPAVPLASQVFTRWMSDDAFRQPDGTPRPLARAGVAGSFDALARSISTDVHPRTVLDELLRLGLVRLDGDAVVPLATSFVPIEGFAELAALFAANAGDHLAAAVHNLSGEAPRFLEQSVFADGLSEESAAALGQVARDLWVDAFDAMVRRSDDLLTQDAGEPGAHRMRFGVYFYSEPDPPREIPRGTEGG